MEKEELKNAVKNHPDVMKFRKACRVEIIICAVLIGVCIFILPPVAFFAACFLVLIGIFYLIFGAIAKIKLKRKS